MSNISETNNQYITPDPQNPVTPSAYPTNHASPEFQNLQPNNLRNPNEITNRNATDLPETDRQGGQPQKTTTNNQNQLIVHDSNSTSDNNKIDLIEEINTIPGPETIIRDRWRKYYIIMDIVSIAGAILFTAALIFIPALAVTDIIMLAIAISSLIGLAITITLDLSTGIFGFTSTISESQVVDKISKEFEAVNGLRKTLDFVTNINPIIRFVKFCWQPPENLKGQDVYYLNRAVQLALLREKSRIASESSTLILKPHDDTLSFVDCNDPENPHQMSPQELKKNLEDIDLNVFVWMDHDLKKGHAAQNSEELIEKEFNKLTNATKAARLLIDKIGEDLRTTNDVQDTLGRCASRINRDLDPQNMAALNIYTPILNSFGEDPIGRAPLNDLQGLPKYLEKLKKSISLTKKITLSRFDQVNQQYLLLKYLKNHLQKNSFIARQLRSILNQPTNLDSQIRQTLENVLNNLDTDLYPLAVAKLRSAPDQLDAGSPIKQQLQDVVNWLTNNLDFVHLQRELKYTLEQLAIEKEYLESAFKPLDNILEKIETLQNRNMNDVRQEFTAIQQQQQALQAMQQAQQRAMQMLQALQAQRAQEARQRKEELQNLR